jgi:hypothetical protein
MKIKSRLLVFIIKKMGSIDVLVMRMLSYDSIGLEREFVVLIIETPPEWCSADRCYYGHILVG